MPDCCLALMDVDEIKSNEETCSTTAAFCQSCSQDFPLEELYRCNSCNLSTENGNEHFIFYCELCIVVLHVKRNHQIIDYRGYKPALCTSHNNICVLFCDTCQIIFCRLCIGIHCSHKLMSITMKAAQVRTKVFALLEEHERLLKPLNYRDSSLREICERAGAIVKSLKPENVADTLTGTCVEIIRENCQRWLESGILPIVKDEDYFWQDESVRLSDTLESVHLNMQDLKSTLNMSDGGCVKSFLSRKTELDNVFESHSDIIEKHFSVSFPAKSLADTLEESLQQALQKIEFPTFRVKRFQQRHLKLVPTSSFKKIKKVPLQKCCSGDQSYNFSSHVINLKLESAEVSFYVLKEFYWGNLMLESFKIDAPNVKVVLRYQCHVAFQLIDNFVLFYNLGTRDYNGLFSMKEELVCFCHSDTNEFRIVGWDRVNYQLVLNTFVFHSLFEAEPSVQCLQIWERPELVTCSVDLVITADKHECVHICDTNDFSVTTIYPLEHGLTRVDKIVIEEKDILVFDYKFKEAVTLVYASEGQQKKWSVLKAEKFNIPCKNSVQLIDFVSFSHGRKEVFALVDETISVGKPLRCKNDTKAAQRNV